MLLYRKVAEKKPIYKPNNCTNYKLFFVAFFFCSLLLIPFHLLHVILRAISMYSANADRLGFFAFRSIAHTVFSHFMRVRNVRARIIKWRKKEEKKNSLLYNRDLDTSSAHCVRARALLCVRFSTLPSFLFFSVFLVFVMVLVFLPDRFFLETRNKINVYQCCTSDEQNRIYIFFCCS